MKKPTKKPKKRPTKNPSKYSKDMEETLEDLIKRRIKLAKENKKANYVIRIKKNHKELARYLCNTCLSPPVSTFVRIIKNKNFTSWRGLTLQMILNQLPKSIYEY